MNQIKISLQPKQVYLHHLMIHSLMIVECKVCGTPFFTYPSKVKIGRGKYCSKECCLKVTSLTGKEGVNTRIKKGQKCWKFQGYRYQQSRVNGNKYRLLFKPDYEGSDSKGYIREHRYIMEVHLGRKLLKSEIVHHKDGNTLNNEVSNLEVMDKRDHDRMNVNLNIHKRWIKGGVVFPPL